MALCNGWVNIMRLTELNCSHCVKWHCELLVSSVVFWDREQDIQNMLFWSRQMVQSEGRRYNAEHIKTWHEQIWQSCSVCLSTPAVWQVQVQHFCISRHLRRAYICLRILKKVDGNISPLNALSLMERRSGRWHFLFFQCIMLQQKRTTKWKWV